MTQTAYEFAELLNQITVGASSSASAKLALAKLEASFKSASSAGSTGASGVTASTAGAGSQVTATSGTHTAAVILFNQFAAADSGANAVGAGLMTGIDGKIGADMSWASMVTNKASGVRV